MTLVLYPHWFIFGSTNPVAADADSTWKKEKVVSRIGKELPGIKSADDIPDKFEYLRYDKEQWAFPDTLLPIDK